MGYGIKLLVYGDYACFTRPEMKGERVSYDVMTPSAARGILEAIYWKPAISWKIDCITVLKRITFESVRRNELGSKIAPGNISAAMKGGNTDLHQYITADRQQRATLLLRDVAYIIEAHFCINREQANGDDSVEKHYNIFLRRARKGQCYHRPYLGCREFAAHFLLVEENHTTPVSAYASDEYIDLGWMLYDIVYRLENKEKQCWSYQPQFFRAAMKNGVIDFGDQNMLPVESGVW
jgi:CRISPR-associated protein Cas5 subtype I-C